MRLDSATQLEKSYRIDFLSSDFGGVNVTVIESRTKVRYTVDAALKVGDEIFESGVAYINVDDEGSIHYNGEILTNDEWNEFGGELTKSNINTKIAEIVNRITRQVQDKILTYAYVLLSKQLRELGVYGLESTLVDNSECRELVITRKNPENKVVLFINKGDISHYFVTNNTDLKSSLNGLSDKTQAIRILLEEK